MCVLMSQTEVLTLIDNIGIVIMQLSTVSLMINCEYCLDQNSKTPREDSTKYYKCVPLVVYILHFFYLMSFYNFYILCHLFSIYFICKDCIVIRLGTVDL